MDRLLSLALAGWLLLAVAPVHAQAAAGGTEFADVEGKAKVDQPMSLKDFMALVRQHPGTEAEVLARFQQTHVDRFEQLINQATTFRGEQFWTAEMILDKNLRWVPTNPDLPGVFAAFGAPGDEVMNALPGGKKQTYKMLLSRLQKEITPDPGQYRAYLGQLSYYTFTRNDAARAAIAELAAESYRDRLNQAYDAITPSPDTMTGDQIVAQLQSQSSVLDHPITLDNAMLSHGESGARPAYRTIIEGFLNHAAKTPARAAELLASLEKHYKTLAKMQYQYRYQPEVLDAIAGLKASGNLKASAGQSAAEALETMRRDAADIAREAIGDPSKQ